MSEYGSPEEVGENWALILIAAVLTVPAVAIMVWVLMAQGRAWDECHDKGGVAQRGLCVSQDGRIIPVGADR